jgi:hypothetical protein
VILLSRRLSESDIKYLEALKEARLAIVTGAQSYKIGSRALTRADLSTIIKEIEKLEGTTAPRFRRIVVRDR